MVALRRLTYLNLALLLLTLVILLSLQHLLQVDRIRLAFGSAILISAIYGGVYSGLFMTLLSVAAADFFFLSPIYAFGIDSRVDFWRLVFLGFEGTLITLISTASFKMLSTDYVGVASFSNNPKRFQGFFLLVRSRLKRFPLPEVTLKNTLIPTALVSITAAAQYRFAIDQNLEFQRLLFSLPIIMSVLWGGFSAGIVATMTSAIAADLFFLQPLYSFGNQNLEDRARLLTLIFTGVFMSGFVQVIFDAALSRLSNIREPAKAVSDYFSLQMISTRLKTDSKLIKSFFTELSNSQLVALVAILPLFLIDAFRLFDRSPIAFSCIPISIKKISSGEVIGYLETVGCLVNLSLIALSATCFFMLDRTQVIKRETDWKQKALALAGTLMLLSFAVLEYKDPTFRIDEVAASVLLIGTMIATAGFLSLGRSFGVVADVRKLKTNGIYRFIRHPIYLGEILIILGLTLMHQSFTAFSILTATVVLLVVRLRNEEKNLTRIFPEYAEYAKKTGRFIPLHFIRPD